VLALLLAAEAALLAAAGILGWAPRVSFLLLAAVAYGAAVLFLFRKLRLPDADAGEALLDGQFYLCGLLALVTLLFGST
jgi:hypothetical protein